MPSRRLTLPLLLVSTLLTLSLGVWVLASALQMTIGRPQQTKDLLVRSGIYQAVIPSQVADVQAANPSLQNLPLSNPEVQKLLGNSLDAKNLQDQGNNAVDAVYAWLEGKSSKPLINITVAANQQELAREAGDYAVQYASKLPTCGPGEADYATLQSDPLSAKCLPAGVDAATVRSTVENAVASNPALGTSTELTQNDVKLSNGKTIMDSFNSAPKWYQRAQKLPLAAAIVAAVCILLVLLMRRPVQGVKSVGKQFLTVGLVLGLVAIGLAWGFEKLYSTFIPKSDNPNVADALAKLSNLFDDAYRDNIVRLSAYLAIGGVVLLVVAFILRRLHHAPAAPATAPAAAPAPGVPVGEPESLAAPPTEASFTPSGPPALPATPADVPAASTTKATKAAKAAKPKTAKKKPASTKRKKKK